jgi:hypothetical protein
VLSFIFVEKLIDSELLLVACCHYNTKFRYVFYFIFKCQCVEGRNMKTAAVIGIERIMLGVIDFSEAMLE